MVDTCHRYETFLSNYEFYPNNIQFRIQSSLAIEKYKNVQRYQLNQLANGKHKFGQETREVLLLKYDMWSRWLMEIENLSIEIMSKRATDKVEVKDLTSFIDLSDKTSAVYTKIITSKHAEYFNQTMSGMWLTMHEQAYSYMIAEIKKLAGYSFSMAFARMTDLLIEVLQYALVELYEIDVNFCKHSTCSLCDKSEDEVCPAVESSAPTVLVFSDICEKVNHSLGVKLVMERAKIYKDYFNIQNVYFKNYTDREIPSACVREIEEMGIVVDYKYSMLHKKL